MLEDYETFTYSLTLFCITKKEDSEDGNDKMARLSLLLAVRSGDDRQVCHRLLQRLALARRAIIGIYFPPIPWPMTEYEASFGIYPLAGGISQS